MSTPPPAAFTGRTIVCALLDQSGSMETLARETISGYNLFIERLRAEGLKNHFVSLTLFDTDVNLVYAMTPLEDVAELTAADYKPAGMTALFDALSETIGVVDQRVTEDDRILFLLITDGLENASQEIKTKAQMSAMIERYTARQNWTFTYLSAAPTAFADADSIGISHHNTQRYVPSSQGTSQAFAEVTRSTLFASASAAPQSNSFYSDPNEPEPVVPGPVIPRRPRAKVPAGPRRPAPVPSTPPPAQTPQRPTRQRRSLGSQWDNPSSPA